MKIVIVGSLYTPHIIGGAEISTQILAEALAAGCEVHVLATGGQKRSAGTATEKIGGVTVHRLPHRNLYWIGDPRRCGTLMRTARKLVDLWNPAQIRAVRELLEAIRPDVVHTQNLSGFGAGVWKACADAGVPVVHTLRDYSLLSPFSSPLRNPLLARMYRLTSLGYSRRVSAVVGISSHILKRHTDAGLFPLAEKLVIPNVVDGEAAGSAKDFSRKPLHIGYFGRIEPEKGVRELVEAVRQLPSRVVDRVTVCGEGSARRMLEAECKGDGRFAFIGKVKPEEARRRMAEVDVTVVPSIWEEPFGRVIIESYQVGTPVYASAVGGIPDVVHDPQRFLFPPGSIGAIKEKIEAYYALPEEEKRNVQSQILRHCRKFTKASMVERHMELYRRVLSERQERQERSAAAAGAERRRSSGRKPVVYMWPKTSPDNKYSELLSRSIERNGLRVEHYGKSSMLKPGRGDIVHLHWPSYSYQASVLPLTIAKSLLFAALLLYYRSVGVRLFWTVHNLWPHSGKSRWDSLMRKFILAVCHRAFALSAAVRQEIAAAFGVPASKIVVTPHGHYVDAYRGTGADIRRRFGIPPDRFLFLFIGRIAPYKGVDRLVEAFRSLPPGPGNNAHLLIAGRPDPGYSLDFASCADDGKIHVHPQFVDDEELADYLRAADAVVLPYRQITTSGSAILALSHYKPVVAPNLGALGEYVSAGCGVLYDPEDPDGLRKALRMSMEMDREETRQAISAKLKELDWDRIAGKMIRVYTDSPQYGLQREVNA